MQQRNFGKQIEQVFYGGAGAMALETGKIRSATIGYGGSFKISQIHPNFMKEVGFDFAAVCDSSPDRLQQAAEDYPGIRTYSHVDDLLAQPDIDLVTVITPHNTHASLGMQVLESGKHCILEKPMCIRADEAETLIRKSREQGVMLTVYHNRRWDGWYLALEELLHQGALGELFHVEMALCNFKQPKNWWRSDKEISGGALYDWGAHYIYWLLGILPGKVRGVRGFTQKRLFHEVSNEDQVDSIIDFESGAVAYIHYSNIAHVGKPRLRLLGTKGALVDHGDGKFIVKSEEHGMPKETVIPYPKQDQHMMFYRNIADHLTKGTDLIITPEQARRIVAIIETTGKSAEVGRELTVPYE
jgi:predicted dehydrogenase